MAYDRYAVECHLTPDGWIEGSDWYFGKLQKQIDPPEGRVLTVKKYSEQSSGWSPEDVRFSVEWRKAAAEKEIEELKKKYPLRGFC